MFTPKKVVAPNKAFEKTLRQFRGVGRTKFAGDTKTKY